MFYTFIWNFCPQLILDGHIYAGVPPLYKVVTSKGYEYLKNDSALEEYQQQNKGKKYEIKRLKGLGEMSIDETEEALINPNSRTIKKITVKNIKEADNLFNQLMGTAIIPRKNFIIQHSKEAEYAI